MSDFTGPLSLTEMPDDNGWLWRLDSPLVYEVGAEGSGRKIEVHPGFVTDGASVPRLLWAWLPAWGPYSRAAVVHDHLCALLVDGRPHPEAPTRRAADAIFFEAMGVLGVGAFTRWVMWLGVRWGAFTHWLDGSVAPNTPFDSADTV